MVTADPADGDYDEDLALQLALAVSLSIQGDAGEQQEKEGGQMTSSELAFFTDLPLPLSAQAQLSKEEPCGGFPSAKAKESDGEGAGGGWLERVALGFSAAMGRDSARKSRPLCPACSLPLSDRYTPRTSEREEKRYHVACALQLFSPHCFICAAPIEGLHSRHPHYEEEKYCRAHDLSLHPQCFSCARREPLKGEAFSLLQDGRRLCPICSSTLLMTSEELKDLYPEVLSFLERELALPASTQSLPSAIWSVPVLAVDLPSLNEHLPPSLSPSSLAPSSSLPPFPYSAPSAYSIVRGVTLSEQRSRRVRHFSWGGQQGETEIERGESSVTAILLLYGLPRLLSASLLAHEATHAFIRLSPHLFPHPLPPPAEEGLCQLMAHKFLQAASGGERDRGWFLRQIEEDVSEVYGEGFRSVRRVEEQVGLGQLVAYLAHYNTLPPI